MALSEGTRLGPYAITAVIGAGGMGEVYRAKDTKLNRDVAIKILPALFANDTERLAWFTREAQTLASLNHPNIAAIYGLEEGPAEAGRHTMRALVMELLEGTTMREALVGGPLPLRKAIAYAVQIAHGLSAAHDKGVVHRDLKPENVFVTADDRVKILDFGLARQEGPATQGSQSMAPTLNSPTDPGLVLGTVGYMAPEQARGVTADARADIFSFGALLAATPAIAPAVLASGGTAFQFQARRETTPAPAARTARARRVFETCDEAVAAGSYRARMARR